jgi:hypothetical protein
MDNSAGSVLLDGMPFYLKSTPLQQKTRIPQQALPFRKHQGLMFEAQPILRRNETIPFGLGSLTFPFNVTYSCSQDNPFLKVLAKEQPMKLKTVRHCLSTLFAIAFIMNAGHLYPADLVTGRWDCSGDGVNGEAVQYVLDLKQSGDQVTGSVTYGSDVVDISKGSVQGNKLELVVTTDDNHYVSIGIVENDKITGTWKDDNGATGKWQAQKQAGK